MADIAKLYRELHKARQFHARTCGANILAFVISPFDFGRFDLEENETFGGIPIIAHNAVQPGRVRVQCANGHGNPNGLVEEKEAPVDDDLEVVSPDIERQRQTERELIPAAEADTWR